jgi:hypothetical protein
MGSERNFAGFMQIPSYDESNLLRTFQFWS